MPPKTDGNLSNRESRGRTGEGRPSGGSAVGPSTPHSSIGAPVEAPAESGTTPAAHVETVLVAEPLTRAPGLTVPPPQPADVVTEPELIGKVTPAYPQVAIAADVQGDVTLEGLVGMDGKVRDITVVRSAHSLLDAAARKAWGQSQYTPARRNGRPEPRRLRITFTFRFKPE